MNDERVFEEIVTKFMLSTCERRPRLRPIDESATALCARLATSHPHDDTDTDYIPLTTGSVAEFYIDPMLPHIGDVDTMYHWSTQLAIPRGHAPPTELPAEFHNYVRVFEIIDSHLPGYVYLHQQYFLTICDDGVKYSAEEYHSQKYLPNRETMIMFGPAIKSVLDIGLLADRVRSVRCLVWPPEAADWPTRHRNYGWPDSATVSRVVSNGCDMVCAVHRLCRQYEWMDNYQWRLSFSRAEIVLLNSWMPVQQIVYHMLRVFIKQLTHDGTSGAGTLSQQFVYNMFRDIRDNDNSGKLSNYHIKTLMLWACELKPQSWWSDSFSLAGICAQLLQTMGVWLTEARCKHYFVNSCNLIDKSFNTTNIGGQLKSTVAASLSKWFVNNYIRKCSELCPDGVSRLFDDISTSIKLQNAVSSVVAWRQQNTPEDLWNEFNLSEYGIAVSVYQNPLTVRSCSFLMTELSKIDSRLFSYFTEVAFLQIAHRSSICGLSEMLMDVLATLFGQIIRKPHYSRNCAAMLSLRKAEKLMKDLEHNPLSTLSLVKIELSKAYLCKTLSREDSESDSIYCLANVYLAVLYYTTGQYQTAIDHCTLVIRSQGHSHFSSHVVQGELLPKINDDVDNMLGLAVFYQNLRTAALNQQCPEQHVSIFSTGLFAYYLHIKCTSLTECRQSSTDELKLYEIYVSTEQPYIGDVLLFVSLSRSLKQKCYREPVLHESRRSLYATEHNEASNLVELLQKFAVEHLTTYRQIEARDFSSVVPIVTTDFEALYAYKRGDYQQCLLLSTQNVHALLYDFELYAPARIPTFPEFNQFMDDDIVSLSALTWFLNTKRKYIAGYTCITQLTLSLYLMTQCQLKLRHSVMSLAQTLDYIKVAERKHGVDKTLDRLVLKMIARKVLIIYACIKNKK